VLNHTRFFLPRFTFFLSWLHNKRYRHSSVSSEGAANQ
jgi:hypothetical protein